MRSLSFVVAEDEPFILRSIIRKIRTLDPSARVLAAALSGDEALEAVARHAPDVLCTDIRMPVVDGLDLIERARKALPDLKVIIISGHGDFNFAQKAIELGVSEYLLKPVKVDDLRRAYLKIQSDLEASRGEDRRQRVLSALYQKSPERTAEGVFGAGSFHLMLAHIGCLDNRERSSAGGIAEAAAARVLGLSDEWRRRLADDCAFSGDCWVAGGRERREAAFVIHSLNGAAGGLPGVVEKTSEMLAEICAGWPFTIGVSAKSVAMNGLSPLRRRLSEMVKARIVPGASRILWLDRSPVSLKTEWCIAPAVRKELSVLARYRYEAELKEAVFRIFSSWERSCCPQVRIERNLLDLLAIFHSESSDSSDSVPHDAEQGVYALLADARDFSSVKEGAWNTLASILNARGSLCGSEEVARRIKAFLDAKYTGEISISNLCAELSISCSFASKAFRRHMGIAPVEYLTRLRIVKAIEFLQTRPELRIQDVGEIVGYPDPHYFSRVFKKLTGVDPLHFRQTSSSRRGCGIIIG